MLLHTLSSRRRRQHGITLILVLSFVLLLTAVVLVFLSRAMNARLLSSGSLKQSSSDQFALSALDVVTGNLKQEIASTALSSSGTYNSSYVVYRPLSSTNAVPICYVNPAFVPSSAPNLLRISSSTDGSQGFPSSKASAVNSTTDASLNGRSVTLARWNSHYLLPLKNPSTASTDSTPSSTFTPDWVLVTDTGTVGPTVLTTPNSSVIGRYAYAIYDEGGLLDANVAGYPAVTGSSTLAQSGDKPALSYADLTQLTLPTATATPLLTATDVNNLVGWRNYASIQETGTATFNNFIIGSSQTQNFFNMVTGNVTGFLTTTQTTFNNRTDQAFLSRQQLIRYIASTGTDTTAHANNLYNALQYLGTFSRDINAPSWSPGYDASSVGGNNGSGTTPPFAYKTNSGSLTISNPLASGQTISNPNRDVLGVRVTGTFTRADGTVAQVGEPLMKYRFPLNRLKGITYQGIDSTTLSTLNSGTLSPASAATIQRDFGLVFVPADGTASPVNPGQVTDLQCAPHWNYCGASGSTIQSSIETLAQVAAENREPNFFEVLKAAILSGSLGRDAGPSGEYLVNSEEGPASGIQSDDLNTDGQVIQIGANILNQVAPDSFPRELHFMSWNSAPLTPTPPSADPALTETAFYGTANLPYFQRIFDKTASITDSTGTAQIGALGWYMAEIWNPHQNFGYTDTNHIPIQFRFCGDGLSAMFIPSFSTQQGDGYPKPPIPPNSSSYDLTKNGYIQFSVPWNSNFCREPTLLSTDNGNVPSFGGPTPYPPNGAPTVTSGTFGPNSYYGNSVEGIFTGSITIPGDDWADPNNHSAGLNPAAGNQPQGCNLYLEYSPDNGATWRIYDVIRNMTGEHDWNPWLVCFYNLHTDPRTDRFGTSLAQWIYSTGTTSNPTYPAPGQSLRQDRGYDSLTYDYFPYPYGNVPALKSLPPGYTMPAPTSGFFYPNPTNPSVTFTNPANILNNFHMATLSDNVSTVTDFSNGLPSSPYFQDQDGIVRPAEGAYATDVNGDGRPLKPMPFRGSATYNNRPIILNRPFRNVGELGYVFRDEPWKNIDFFTSSTGDAGLLDFFCINESTTNTPMVAGTVNLNTRQAPVLQAILAGATRDETGNASSPNTTPILNTEAASIASAIVAWTQSTTSGQGPFQYRGDLLTKAASTLVVNNANTQQQQIKIQREAALRALSDVGTTRTWTLLVDLVAQVGHYPPGSTSLKQFVVDGEKRYWLHLTLDRYTGQVVDRVLEPVYE